MEILLTELQIKGTIQEIFTHTCKQKKKHFS